jgi:hypothetical protein
MQKVQVQSKAGSKNARTIQKKGQYLWEGIPVSSYPTVVNLKEFYVPAELIAGSRCGGYDGGFAATVTFAVDKLDKDGFVFEVNTTLNEIRQRFERDVHMASCEELAAGVANVLCMLVDERLVKVTVQVKNLTGHIDVVWVRGMPVPAFPMTFEEAVKAGRAKESDRDTIFVRTGSNC